MKKNLSFYILKIIQKTNESNRKIPTTILQILSKNRNLYSIYEKKYTLFSLYVYYKVLIFDNNTCDKSKNKYYPKNKR